MHRSVYIHAACVALLAACGGPSVATVARSTPPAESQHAVDGRSEQPLDRGSPAAPAPIAAAEPAEPAAFAVGGHGVMMTFRTASVVRRELAGTLYVWDQREERRGVRVRVGATPAEEGFTEQPGAAEVHAFRSGASGPVMVLGPEAHSLEDVFERIDVGLPDADWQILTDRFFIDLPEAFRVMRGAGHRLLELTPLLAAADPDTLISFQVVARPSRSIRGADLVPPHWTIERMGSTRTRAGRVPWIELGYQHEGSAWRQRRWLLPHPAGTVVVTSQGPISPAVAIHETAERLVRSYATVDTRSP